MFVLRAVKQSDEEALLTMAGQVGDGMTTFKPDRAQIRQRIATACSSFLEQIPLQARDYVFVLEDVAAQRLAGVCAIKSAVGLVEPFYNYRIGTLVHSSAELQVYSQMETLYLSNDLTGCAELCSLFLHTDYRSGLHHKLLGKLLSKSRFLFIAQFPHLFPEKIIAEMRGYQDEQGRSPFWESLGRHFFKMDFKRADDITSLGKKSFIAELMPRYPLYVACLPAEAQAVIGRVHVDTEPARRLLLQEGMHYEGYIDIFDAGPVLQVRVGELRATRESTLSNVQNASDNVEDVAPMMIAHVDLQNFRVIAAPALQRDGCISLTNQQQDLLHYQAGEKVRAMLLNPI